MSTINQLNHPDDSKNDAIISYLLLRKLIGVVGLLLPVILPIGTYIFSKRCNFQPSISHYYYTTMHIVFVGMLCVLGGFLITYRGTTRGTLENRISNLAGAFAFGVAIFPTLPDDVAEKDGSCCQFVQLITQNKIPDYIGWLHFGFAGLLFGCFIIFCMKIFQESDENKAFDSKKIRRNRIYTSCGFLIIISIISIAAITIWDRVTGKNNFPYHTFIFETTALMPFGFSWLLKGSLNWKHSKHKMVRKMMAYVR